MFRIFAGTPFRGFSQHLESAERPPETDRDSYGLEGLEFEFGQGQQVSLFLQKLSE